MSEVLQEPDVELSKALDLIHKGQREGRQVFRAEEFSRNQREGLLRRRFARRIISGWLMPHNPARGDDDPTLWHACFWQFCGSYASRRFGDDWHLSPLQSMLVNAESSAVPTQVVLFATKGANNRINLPFGTSLFDLNVSKMPSAEDVCVRDGLRMLTPEAALVHMGPKPFESHSIDVHAVMSGQLNARRIATLVRQGRKWQQGERLAKAFRNCGRRDFARAMDVAMRYRPGSRVAPAEAGADAEHAPPAAPAISSGRLGSAIASRLRALWHASREPILRAFPEAPGLPLDNHGRAAYLASVDDAYVQDAYNSLSIEGYQVTQGLVDLVRSGEWRPDSHADHAEQRNALAARGYWLAAQAVRASIEQILMGKPAGAVLKDDMPTWFESLFEPFVEVGHLEPTALVGYRQQAVFLRGSRHVPPRVELIQDAMQTLHELLSEEDEPAVRAVSGHWMLGYIHPFPDGNGRTARFTMNAMLSSGGYPWTVVRVEHRKRYLQALESASIDHDFKPFATFISEEVRQSKHKPQASAQPSRKRRKR